MADTYKKLSDFLQASSFGDDDLLLVSQSGTTRVIKGTKIKEYAKAAGVEAAKITSATVSSVGHLLLTTTDGTVVDAGKVTGDDGVSVTDASIDAAYHLILTFSDGSTVDAGYCRGASGAGTGDMQEAEYDATGAVKSGGGIALYTLPVKLTLTLTTAGWSENTQTVTNTALKASGFSYIVSPAYASISAYNDAGIRAQDVTTDGSMTFVCDSVPSVAVTVEILKVRVQ